MKHLLSSFTTVYILGTMAWSQQYVSVTVSDSKSPASIENAVVEELNSGQVTVTDSQGEAQFPAPFTGSQVLRFRVDAPGFPARYFERSIPEEPLGYDFASHHSLEITQENEFVSPIVGPAGGSKTATIPTGYFLTDLGVSPEPIEYSQSVDASIPPSSLNENYRIGISLIPGAGQAENLVGIEQLGTGKAVFAQFELNWLDVSGNSVPTPVMGDPIVLGMSPASLYMGHELHGAWQVSLYRFDESSLSWIEAAEGTSGLGGDGDLWAALTQDGYYSFIGHRVDIGLSGYCDDEWIEHDWLGPAEDEADVTCPNLPANPGGAQAHVTVTHGANEGSAINAELTASLSTKLKLMGLKSEASVVGSAGKTDTWGTYKEKTFGWSDHAYAGEGFGKIYLHQKGYILQLRRYCYNTDIGVLISDEILIETDPIKTGYAVRKNLQPCP